MLLYFVLISILRYSSTIPVVNDGSGRASNQSASTTCLTPDNLAGNCTSIRNCPMLLELVNTTHESVKNYLRQSFCGRNAKDGIPKVCCPLSADRSHSDSSIFKSSSSNTTEFTVQSQAVSPPTSTSSTSQAHRADTKHHGKDFSKCGLSNRKATKIIGGQEASLGDWPWMGALFYRTASDSHLTTRCSGTLISKEWIVTAAHCFSDRSLIPVSVRLADLNLDDKVADGANPIDVPIAEVITHPEFSTRPPVNDIALIRLKNPVEFSEHVRPICLFNESETFRSHEFYSNKVPFIMGWGKLNYEGPLSSALQEAQINVIAHETCAKNYVNYNVVIDDRVLCAGGKGKDTCRGDSGGPLVTVSLNRHYLAGVVSFGVGCGDPNFPGVYTKVALFLSWIARVTQLPI